MNEIERDFRTQSQHLLWSVWRGLLVGVAAGAVVSLFRWLIAKGGPNLGIYLPRRPEPSSPYFRNCPCQFDICHFDWLSHKTRKRY